MIYFLRHYIDSPSQYLILILRIIAKTDSMITHNFPQGFSAAMLTAEYKVHKQLVVKAS